MHSETPVFASWIQRHGETGSGEVRGDIRHVPSERSEADTHTGIEGRVWTAGSAGAMPSLRFCGEDLGPTGCRW